jgi:prevent-host-death family protein
MKRSVAFTTRIDKPPEKRVGQALYPPAWLAGESHRYNRTGTPPLSFMTISGHNVVMKTAKVSELKARLSAYLSEVRKGGKVVVYDRNTPIAQLIPFGENEGDIVIVESTAPVSELRKLKGVRPQKPVDTDKLLQELRADK